VWTASWDVSPNSSVWDLGCDHTGPGTRPASYLASGGDDGEGGGNEGGDAGEGGGNEGGDAREVGSSGLKILLRVDLNLFGNRIETK